MTFRGLHAAAPLLLHGNECYPATWKERRPCYPNDHFCYRFFNTFCYLNDDAAAAPLPCEALHPPAHSHPSHSGHGHGVTLLVPHAPNHPAHACLLGGRRWSHMVIGCYLLVMVVYRTC